MATPARSASMPAAAPNAAAAAPPIKLKIRTPASGDKVLSDPSLTRNSSLADLQARLQALTGIPPAEQQISTTYPPPGKELRSGEQGAASITLGELKVMSGDVLVLKRVAGTIAAAPVVAPSVSPDTALAASLSSVPVASPAAPPAAAAPARSASSPQRPSSPPRPPPASLSSLSHLRPLFVHPIANDNSCLFNAVGGLVEGWSSLGSLLVTELRQTVATVILSDDSDKYTEAALGENKETYAQSIMKPNTWGGGIELSILAEYFNLEIAAYDIESCHLYVFGQEDSHDSAAHGGAGEGKRKTRRIYLVYYGVHYDALEDDSCSPPTRIFSPDDALVAQRALLAARQLQAAGSFTNVSKFKIRCAQCQVGLVGAVDAQEHAKVTGHQNFEEYAK